LKASPVFAVRDLAAAMAFYSRLGFAVRRFDGGYGYAERDGLKLHLRASPEIEPFSSHAEVWVETAAPDPLHEEWRSVGLLPVVGSIGPELRAEVRSRLEAGDPVGLISARVEDKPWGVREFSIRDLDDNQLRFGRSSSRSS
jgi:catechol 2,3-dioxygenase-like lactoylglutathione lyase family enzyme